MARWHFFQAIALAVPRARQELTALASTLEGADVPVLDPAIEDALSRWATHWGLPYDDAWWMEPVREALRYWRRCPADTSRWPPLIGGYRVFDWPKSQPPDRFPFVRDPSILEWHATEETEEHFRARVEQYIADKKRMPGTRPTLETFTISDFTALALEHVARQPSDRISSTRDASNTRKRNRQLANLLGLPLRRRAPGRPTKTRRP